jgi:predicted kinase
MTIFDFIESFKLTPTWATMAATVENSPWHREANVAVHTEMCIEQYMTKFAAHRTENQTKIALAALLFHDTGKPSAEEVLEKKDGSGVYRRYAGHEQDSAVAFTELYLKSPELQTLLSPMEARAVRWTIEHHLPYGMTDKVKRQGLRAATFQAFYEIGLDDQTFFDCLRSDAAGRISDGHEEKLANVEAWINEFLAIEPTPSAVRSMRVMYLLIGPSGSGKTTWRKAREEALAENGSPSYTISHDEWKIEFYRAEMNKAFAHWPEPASEAQLYAQAWQYATIDHESEFKKFVTEKTNALMVAAKNNHGHVFVDVVNASKKKRTQFVDLAKRHGLAVCAVEFWNTFETLVGRQQTRGDKAVPAASIKNQLYATTCAWLGHEAQTVIMEIGS